MVIGVRLRKLREERKMSQGDVEETTGLKKCYTSRVEHGHTVPSLETLEKYAAAYQMPLYRLFYEGKEPPQLPKVIPRENLEELAKVEGKRGEEARFLLKLKRTLAKISQPDRKVFLAMVHELAAGKK
jgi:transcriptional regulator with XRE-family HTH domain